MLISCAERDCLLWDSIPNAFKTSYLLLYTPLYISKYSCGITSCTSTTLFPTFDGLLAKETEDKNDKFKANIRLKNSEIFDLIFKTS